MSQHGVYAESKLVWWWAREQKLPEGPKQVHFILSDLCDQDCSFCAYRMSGYTSNELFLGDSEAAVYGHSNPKRWIPTQRAMKLLEEFLEVGVLSVQFTGGGEPTVHPEHPKIFKQALDLGLRCALVSNGALWKDGTIRNILPRFDWVRVSVDAGTQDSYIRIRRTTAEKWDLAWRNLSALAQVIRERGTPTLLGVGFVVTPESWTEIGECAALAKKAGAQNIRITAMYSPEEERPYIPLYEGIRCEIDRTRRRVEDESFRVYDNFGSRFADLSQHAPDYRTCAYQHYTTYIGGDLKSYRCCVLAYNRRGLVPGGDLSRRSFAEFWKSQERKDDMNALDARGCPRCQFNSKNRELLYVMGNTESDISPRHIEFP